MIESNAIIGIAFDGNLSTIFICYNALRFLNNILLTLSIERHFTNTALLWLRSGLIGGTVSADASFRCAANRRPLSDGQ